MDILLALLLGGLFGFALDRTGATNPTLIIRMLNFSDLRLMKKILFAIGFASILTFFGQMVGLVDVGHLSIKAASAGVFVGGLLLGFGWALSGYCPGTGVVALASRRKDALWFVFGGLAGAFAYMLTYPSWKASGVLDSILGGKVTLGTIPGAKYEGLMMVSGDLVGIALGLLFVAVSFILPERLDFEPTPVPQHS